MSRVLVVTRSGTTDNEFDLSQWGHTWLLMHVQLNQLVAPYIKSIAFNMIKRGDGIAIITSRFG